LFGSLKACPQSLTQLVFLITEGRARIIANNPCFAQTSGSNIDFMKNKAGVVFAWLVTVN
jgi:hypothetical protein